MNDAIIKLQLSESWNTTLHQNSKTFIFNQFKAGFYDYFSILNIL